MQLFLERMLYFWAAITVIGLLLVVLVWTISTVIYVAFISLFVAIVTTAFCHFYWEKKDD
jgi:hypothetical protein|tara:strand:- start:376 stop:555 length:180 start_codon:yes stop_codon:yes gene_type:complete